MQDQWVTDGYKAFADDAVNKKLYFTYVLLQKPFYLPDVARY